MPFIARREPHSVNDASLITSAAADDDGGPARQGITLYGAPWCGDTRRSQALLRTLNVPFTDIDVDQDSAANAWATAQRGGERRVPTIFLADGEPLLFEPSDADLRAALVRTGYLSRDAADAAD